MKTLINLFVMIAGLVLLSPSGRAQMAMPAGSPSAPAKKVAVPPYPFDTSIVSGAKLPAHPVVFVDEGYEVKVATAAEQAAVQKDPAPFLAKIKQACATAKPYPLGTCLVCGMPLEDDDITFVYLGQQYKVCGGDEDCFQVFQKDPAAYVKKLNEMVQRAQAPAK